MPTQTELRAAGKQALISAIQRHGGQVAVAKLYNLRAATAARWVPCKLHKGSDPCQ